MLLRNILVWPEEEQEEDSDAKRRVDRLHYYTNMLLSVSGGLPLHGGGAVSGLSPEC